MTTETLGAIDLIMELPEKLYFGESDKGILEIYSARESDNEVEYVRTDVFIKKAEKYLTEKFINDVSVLSGGVVSINFNAAISNFVKYMEESKV
jgi:hypothetical protein